MSFSYSTKTLAFNLIFGLFWLFSTGMSWFTADKMTIISYFKLLLSVVYLALFLYYYLKKYVIINKDSIQINTFPSHQIAIREIVDIHYFAEEYKIKTEKNSYTILKSLMDKKSWEKFEQEMLTIKNNLFVPSATTLAS